jgi:hypothetical protein
MEYQVINDREQPMKSAQPTVDYLEQSPRPRGGLSWIRYPVYVTAGMVGAFLLYRSLGLYQQAFLTWGLNTIGKACLPLLNAPLIGNLFLGACSQGAALVMGMLTIAALITLTILQSLPTAIYFHPKAIAGMVTQLRLNRKGRPMLSSESGDTEEIKALVNRHNSLSDRQLRTLLIFSVAGFAVEFWIVRTARGDGASVTAALVDSLGFDVLVVATLAFSGIFRPQSTTKTRRYGD